jgi:hypothetical protein
MTVECEKQLKREQTMAQSTIKIRSRRARYQILAS